MKQLLKVIGNILSLGIPLLVRVLSKAKKFQQIADQRCFVTLDQKDMTITIQSPVGIDLLLRVDLVSDKDTLDQTNV